MSDDKLDYTDLQQKKKVSAVFDFLPVLGVLWVSEAENLNSFPPKHTIFEIWLV